MELRTDNQDRVVHLVDRPVYSMGQVDRLLKLHGGTAKRWIDGYVRSNKHYPPVIREESTGDPIATWGEFVEARLLSEYRDAGVPLVRMRPAIEKLREELGVKYPLASSKMWLEVAGQELVRRVEDAVNLDRPLRLVVRTGQQVLDWSEPAKNFKESVEWSVNGSAEPKLIRPLQAVREVEIDPLRSFGEPVVRGVPTDVVAELFRAGERTEEIASLYDLSEAQVNAALRYELSQAA